MRRVAHKLVFPALAYAVFCMSVATASVQHQAVAVNPTPQVNSRVSPEVTVPARKSSAAQSHSAASDPTKGVQADAHPVLTEFLGAASADQPSGEAQHDQLASVEPKK